MANLKKIKSSRFRGILLFISENNKILKSLRFFGFERLVIIYLRKSNRSLFIVENNMQYWESENRDLAEIIQRVDNEGRSLAFSVQKLFLVELLLQATLQKQDKIIEIGTYKGGTAVLFRRVLDKFRGGFGEVVAFDTFEGHPHVNNEIDLHSITYFRQKDSLETLKYLESNNVTTVVGDALITFDFSEYQNKVSFLHLDVDLYDVTKKFLQNLDQLLVANGICVVDDFGKPSCPGIGLAFSELKTELEENFIILKPMTYQLVLIKK
jgi:hypothetical protein